MKLFGITLLVVGLLLIGCSNNNNNPTSSISSQMSGQEVSPIKSEFGIKATVPTPIPAVTIVASVDTLFPSNGTLQTVMFTGAVSNILHASYVLTDEYGIVSFADTLFNGTFAVSLSLPAVTDSADLNGRNYIFTVSGIGTATVTASDTVVVAYQVPNNGGGTDDDHEGDSHHDNGNHYGENGKGNNGHNGHDGKGNKENKHDDNRKHR